MRTLAISLALMAAAAAAVACPSAAFAGKPGGGGGGGKAKVPAGSTSISLVLLASPDGLAHYGQDVSFEVSSTQTSQPWVNLDCYQGGALVSQSWEGMFAGSLDNGIFGLYSPQWTGGAADCTATVTTATWARLTSLSFHVYG